MIKNWIGGSAHAPGGPELAEILNPATQEFIDHLHDSQKEDIEAAVQAARLAQKDWANLPMVRRCRILFTIKEKLEQRADELAATIVKENGKTFPEAQAEVRRGIEVVELAAGMPSLSKGDFFPGIAGEIDGYMTREPLGVVAGACPFNFPAMIPMWMFPVAIALGNSFILKPSEKCPLTANLIAEIFHDGGLPAGVLNIVHGSGPVFEALIENPTVQALSFVGSSPIAEKVYQKGTQLGKRVQALGGAKNFLFVLPDADVDDTVNAIVGSAFGCAGERCMATSVLMLVGDCNEVLKKVTEKSAALQIGDGMNSDTQMGPLISAPHKERVSSCIEKGLKEGAKLLLDGRDKGKDLRGNFLGATLLDQVEPDMELAQEEIFGPVLSIMRADTLDSALEKANSSSFGNGASIFTRSGAAAAKFRREIECGMIGINAGVPAPMAFISFGGFKKSLFGDLKTQGTESIEFYSKRKAVIERWAGHDDVWGK